MSIEISRNDMGGVPVVRVKGEVDLYSSPRLRQALRSLGEQKKTKLLIIDLTEVEYMDSSGVATLIEALQKLNQTGGRLRLAGLTDAVAQVLRFAHLDKVFDIHADVEEALES